MITFLHTAGLNVKRFEDLVRKYNSEIEIKHFVNEDLLRFALTHNRANSEAFRDEVQKIKKEPTGLIVCTCSSYGDECDLLQEIERIDKPVAEYLVANYQNIGLAYTAKSTLASSLNLLNQVAESLHKSINIIEYDCTGCWKYLEQGDTDRYEREIAAIIEKQLSPAEAIFLAQASMENARHHLHSFDKEVISSPEYGVKKFLEKLSQTGES